MAMERRVLPLEVSDELYSIYFPFSRTRVEEGRIVTWIAALLVIGWRATV